MPLYPGGGLTPGGAPVIAAPAASLVGHLLTDTVDVFRPTFTPDGRGGRSASFAFVASMRAKVNQPSPSEGKLAGRDGAMMVTPVHLDAGVDVRRGDELEVGGPRRLRVVDVVTNSRASYLRADCEVVQGGP